MAKKKFNMAIDADGKSLDHTDDEIRDVVMRSHLEGKVIAQIIRLPNGDLTVTVYEPPSMQVVDDFEVLARAYRRAVEGH